MDSGEKLDVLFGEIEFKNVSFNYPARPEINVLNSLNLNIKSGSTIALVGNYEQNLVELLLESNKANII